MYDSRVNHLLLVVAQTANLLVNGSFTDGMTGWSEFSTGGTNASYLPIPGGVAIDVTPQSGSNSYDAQLRQYPKFDFKKGETLRLAFRARAASANRIEAYMQEGTAPYSDFGRKAIALTPEFKEYVLAVKASGDMAAGSYQVGLQVNFDREIGRAHV